MSAGRFKPRDDYFGKRSGFAERVIQARPSKVRRRAIEPSVPAALLRVHFCKTVETFEIEGRGRFKKGEHPLDEALGKHLDGAETMRVNPLSHTGETAFTVAKFDLSDSMDLPFSRARAFAEELLARGIPSLIEVTEGGKGHYHLWVFHEEPVSALPFSEALVRLGNEMFDTDLETVPSLRGEAFVTLPLQGESVLLQRRVFVNAVGKMIRDQGGVLASIAFCPRKASEKFVRSMASPAKVAAPSAGPGAAAPEAPAPAAPPPAEKIPVQKPPAKPPEPAPAPAPRETIAAKPDAAAAPPSMVRLLCFSRGNMEFGVPPETAERILPLDPEHRIAAAGTGVRGTVRVPGGAAILFDPYDAAGKTPAGPPRFAVLLRGRDEGCALLADRVYGMRDVHSSGAGAVTVPRVTDLRRSGEDRASAWERTMSGAAGGSFVVVARGESIEAFRAESVRRVLPSDAAADGSARPAPAGKSTGTGPAVRTPRRGKVLVVSRGEKERMVRVDRVIGIVHIPADRITLVPGSDGVVRATARPEGFENAVTLLESVETPDF